VVAKISHSGRVHKLRQHLGPWQPTSSPGRDLAAILLTTVPDLEPTALADAYDGRAMMEATFCQDKQALGLVKRRQHK
jgi:hypothetical protein